MGNEPSDLMETSGVPERRMHFQLTIPPRGCNFKQQSLPMELSGSQDCLCSPKSSICQKVLTRYYPGFQQSDCPAPPALLLSGCQIHSSWYGECLSGCSPLRMAWGNLEERSMETLPVTWLLPPGSQPSPSQRPAGSS